MHGGSFDELVNFAEHEEEYQANDDNDPLKVNANVLKYCGINDGDVKCRDGQSHASEDGPKQQFVLPQLHAPDGLAEVLAIKCVVEDEQRQSDEGRRSRSVDWIAVDGVLRDNVAVLAHDASVKYVENEQKCTQGQATHDSAVN